MRLEVLLLSVIITTGILTSFVPIAAADSYEVNIDVPSTAKVGDSVSISGSVHVPDHYGEWQTDVEVTVFIDGSRTDQRTVTVRDGETARVSFSYSYQTSGDHRIRIKGETSYGEWSYSDSASATITVREPPTEAPTPTPPGQVSVDGATFSVPPSLQDEAEQVRSSTGATGRAFLLATKGQAYLVFCDCTPKTGIGSVEGGKIGETSAFGNLTLTVVRASYSSFRTAAEAADLASITANPAEYELELIETSGYHTRVTVLTDPDEGQNVTAVTASGMLSTDDEARNIFENVGKTARTLVHQPSQEDVQEILGSGESSRMGTISFRHGFWYHGEYEVKGVVLTPQSAAYRVAAEVAPDRISALDGEQPVLYTVRTTATPTQVNSVRELNRRSGELDGRLVQIEVPLVHTRTSVQELLGHSTPCAADQFPVKEVCVELTTDVLVTTGVAWSSPIEGGNDSVLVIGASSGHQDRPTKVVQGQYRITGEVVSSNRINTSLPDRAVLIVHNLDRRGAIEQVPMAVKRNLTQFEANAQAQVNMSVDGSETGTSNGQSGNTGPAGTTPTDSSGPGFGLAAPMVGVLLLLLFRLR